MYQIVSFLSHFKYEKQLVLNDANVMNAVGIREDMRSRIKKLYDRLEAIRVRKEKWREEHHLSEQNLESELHCLRRVRDILLSSSMQGEAPATVVDVEQDKLIELRRQRACLLIQKCKAAATLQRFTDLHTCV
ncbi:unnamed protein product [Anisakis simplex]|uniref:Uncharacterized protein n=1 Tax=Anisakis simplex TaxID=6269 RepID=A0A0M3JYQ2_ANISI|nr:unnamed protein product [Anisakis simplex]